MSGLETLIIYVSGTLLLTGTAAKFLMKEAIAVVILYKELKATIKSEYPSSPLGQELNAKPLKGGRSPFTKRRIAEQPQLVNRIHSKRELNSRSR